MQKTMLAAVYHGLGDLRLEERPVPVLKEPGDAIVKVTLSTICTSDLHILNGAVPRAVPGTVLGHEFVGEIVSVGESVKKRKVGERVAANCITFCGTVGFAAKGLSTTVRMAAGNSAAGSTAAKRNMSACHMRIQGLPQSQTM